MNEGTEEMAQVRKSKQYRAYDDDVARIDDFIERHGMKTAAEFMHLVAEHLNVLEAAITSSQIATKLPEGTAAENSLQIETNFRAWKAAENNSSPVGTNFATTSLHGATKSASTAIVAAAGKSIKLLHQYDHHLQPDIFLTADLGDCKVWHVNNVRFNESVQYPSLFPEPEHWTVEQRLDYFHRLETEGKLYGNACFGVRDLYNARRDLPLDFNDDPKIKTKYGWITEVFLEYHPWYVHPEWCDFHLLRELDHERILFPELDGPEGTQQVLAQLDAHPMQGPLRDMRHDHGEVKHWLV